jgi:hypothetical protein
MVKLDFNIVEASNNDKERWNQFVDLQGGSFFHYYDWKFIFEVKKNHRFIPIFLENSSSDIIGIFPIVENRELAFPSLFSLPYGSMGGFLLSRNLSEQTISSALQSLLNHVDETYSDTHSLIELREYLPFTSSEYTFQTSDILKNKNYKLLNNRSQMNPVTHIIYLSAPFKERIWMELWSNRLRKRIRHARKMGMEVIYDHKMKFVDDYVRMYISSLKKFNVAQTEEEIKKLLKVFKERTKIFIGLVNSNPISAALCHYTPHVTYLSKAPYYSDSLNYLTNTLPICASIKDACESGYRYYEMGVTTTPELAFYKEKFGGERVQLRIYRKEFSPIKKILNICIAQPKLYGRKMKYFHFTSRK